MKKTLVTLSLGLAALFTVNYQQESPKPISITAPTEQGIKEEFKNEQRANAIRRAVASARMVYRANICGENYSDVTGRTAYEYGLSPRLLAAVVIVESSCRETAVSGRSSVGLMQVNPKVWGHSSRELKDPARNLKIGAAILASYIRQFGVVEGLHHYNGYSEIHGHEYVNKVLTVAGIGG